MWFLFAQPVWAAEVDFPLDLDEAVALAREVSPAVRAQVLRVQEADLSVRALRRPEDPQVRARMERIGSRTDTPQYTLRLRQNLEPLGAIRGRVQEARAATAVEQADLAALEAELTSDVASLHDALRFLDAGEALVQAEIDACTEWLAVVEKRREAGVGDAGDVLEAELQRLGATRRLTSVQQDRSALAAELGVLLGLDAGTEITVDGPPLDSLVAVESSDDLPADPRTQARLAEAEARKRAIAAEKRPWLDFVEGRSVFERGGRPELGVTVAARIPIFSLSDGSIAAADARVQVFALEKVAQGEARELVRSHYASAATRSASVAQGLAEAIDTVATMLETEREAMRPDQYWEHAADLARERQEHLERLHAAVVARRGLQSLVMMRL